MILRYLVWFHGTCILADGGYDGRILKVELLYRIFSGDNVIFWGC